MTDWETCPAVETVPGKVSGASIFTGTRVPVSALFENLASGATVEEFLEWFPGVEEWQVRPLFSSTRPRPYERPPSREDPVRSGHARASSAASRRPHGRHRGGARVVGVGQWRLDC